MALTMRSSATMLLITGAERRSIYLGKGEMVNIQRPIYTTAQSN